MKYSTWWNVWELRPVKVGRRILWSKALEKQCGSEEHALDSKQLIQRNRPNSVVTIEGMEVEKR